ncbi:hypothetical protein N431DRAFT_245358 [Stipitochalara longipes BDJ]|nr:hypothetical protein N431DRAFT_245358 [Stipitochalara longipes BDJ]
MFVGSNAKDECKLQQGINSTEHYGAYLSILRYPTSSAASFLPTNCIGHIFFLAPYSDTAPCSMKCRLQISPLLRLRGVLMNP